jgi:hypothetical protein
VVEGGPDENWELWPAADSGEIRRLTMLLADLVDSTALSTRIAPEIYRTVVGRYREPVRQTQLGFYSSFMVERQRALTATMSG